MTQPLVTVIVTVFTRTAYLEQAIRSAVDQTYKNLEIIVTDDSNSRSIRELCLGFARDKRVRYRANTTVVGVALNIRAALEESTGEYVVILNDDDIMELFMIERLVSPLSDDKQCVLSFADHWIVTCDGELDQELTARNSAVRGRTTLRAGIIESPVSFAIRGGVSVVMGALFRRAACRIDWFDERVKGAYDYWLAVKLALAGPFFFVPEKVMKYRAHGLSESARLSSDKVGGEVFVYKNLLATSLSRSDRTYVRARLRHDLFVLGRDRLYFGDRILGQQAFFQSLRYGMSLKSLLGIALAYSPVRAQRWILRTWRSGRGLQIDLPGIG